MPWVSNSQIYLALMAGIFNGNPDKFVVIMFVQADHKVGWNNSANNYRGNAPSRIFVRKLTWLV